MTPSELKYQVEQSGSNPYFFTRKTMKFFGDTMRNYGARSAGDNWELYRKRPVKHGLNSSTYFDKVTFERVFVNPEVDEISPEDLEAAAEMYDRIANQQEV